MNRGTFKILCRDFTGYKTVDRKGYLFDYGKYRFGCHKSNNSWVVTLLVTGCRVNNFIITKKSDVVRELENHNCFEMLDKINFDNEKMREYMEIIVNAYRQDMED